MELCPCLTLFLPLLLMSLQRVSCSSVSSCLLSRSLNWWRRYHVYSRVIRPLTSSMGRLMISLQGMGRPRACA